MATTWKAPTWRMPNEKNQSKFESYSLDFDGSGNYIDVSNFSFGLMDTNVSSTVSLWANFATLSQGTNVVLFEQNTSARYVIWFKNSDNTINFYVNANKQSYTVNANQWYNIIATLDGTTARFYINGSEIGTGLTYTPANTNQTLIIGANPTLGQYFDGKISDTTIFDYALSSNQISSLYNSGSPINPMTLKPAPIAYYPLGGNASTAGNIGSDTLSVPNVAVPDASVFDFDGSSNQFINNGYFNELDSSDLSFSIWLKKTNTDYAQVVDSQTAGNSGILIAINSSDQVFVRVNTLTASTTTSGFANIGFQRDKWQNIILTYNNTTRNLIVYLNNQPVSNTTGSLTTKGASLELKIGGVSGSYFTGQISNAQIWSTELSSSEVETLYNSGVPLLTGTQPQASSLKAWYKLDQSANWEADTTGNWQIPDTVSSYPQSFDFDTSRIQVSNQSLGITSQIAISAWVKIPDGSTGGGAPNIQQIVSEDTTSGTSRNWNLSWRGGGYKDFSFSVFHSDGTDTSLYSNVGDINDGNWHHVVGTWDGTTNANAFKIYVDNVATSTTSTKTDIRATSNVPTTIGAIPNTFTWAFEGNISNVQIWDISLDSTQVQTLYNNGVPLKTAIATDNLKAWYKLDNNEKFDGANWSVENQKYPAGFDSALDFDGNSDVFIGSPSAIQNLTNITLSVWVKVPNTFSLPYYTVASKGEYAASGSQWYLTIKTANSGPGGTFAIYKTSDSTSATAVNYTTNIDDNKWHNIVCINDGTDLKVYIDGQLDGTNAGNGGNIYNGNRDLKIGRLTASSIRNFDGLMSNMVIWEDSQETEVPNIYNNGTPATSYTNTPVAWWKLNNTTTGIQDSAGSNDGTNNGATKVNTFVSTEAGESSGMTEQNLVNNNVSALNGESSGMNTSNLVTSTLTRQIPYNSYSLNFDGVNDYISIGSSIPTSNQHTVSTWIKSNDLTNSTIGYLFSTETTIKGIGLDEGDGSFGAGKFYYWNGSSPTVVSTTAITVNNWHYIAFVFDSTTNEIKFYLDGNLDKTTSVSIGTAANIKIIGSYNGTLHYLNGKLSNMSIFNEALTSTEIMKLYNSGVPSDLSSFTPSPISWWSLSSDSYFNGSNYICPDLVDTNNGTSSGMDANALVGDAPNSTANGTSTNMSIDANLTGSAPNSSNNSFSVNMSYDDRVSGTGNVPG